ncbi:coiled-coil domain-containing protein [Gimesia panareensis]|uniref:hypothetical protein n=1 Tax=Gimesia panareensis TaxID=2527978 RepID=UPI00118B9CA1|nr:hypothetical protein [Gimesia panareensis]QDU53545.1 hypothetical protein Pan110_59370 [Gimesia panareensis]
MVDAQRNVIISLKLTGDPNNQNIAKQVNSQVLDAERVRTQTIATEAIKRSDAAKLESRERERILLEAAKEAEKKQKEQANAEAAAQKELERSRLKAEREAQKERDAIAKAEARELEHNLREKVKAAERAEKERVKAADLASKKAIAIQQEEADNLADILNAKVKNQQKESQAVSKYRESIDDKIKETNKLYAESKQKANEAAVIAVQGLADIVKGSAKLGLVSEDNLQKFLKLYDVVQEGFLVFIGATDVWWKGREALIALSTATNAQTTANNLMAASNLRVAATQAAGSATAGTNMIGGGTVLGGATIALTTAGKAAGVVALGVAVHDLFVLFEKSMEGLATSGGRLREVLDESATFADTFTGGLWEWYKAEQHLEESTKNLTKAEKKRLSLLEERSTYLKQESSRVDLQKQLRGAGNVVSEARGLSAGETNLQKADRIRLEAVRELRAAEQELAEDKLRQDERVSRGHLRSSELTLRLLQDREAAQKRVYDAEVNRLSIIRSENEALRDQLKSEQKRLKVLQKSKQTEEQSLKAKLGQLSSGLQDRTIEIAKKIKSGGKIDRREASILQEAGIGQEYIDDFYARQVQNKKGVNTFTEVFGASQLKGDLAVAGKSVVDKQQNLNQRVLAEQQAEQNLTTTAQLLKQSTEARIKHEAELKNILLEEIKGLNNNAQQVQQAAADASDAIQQQGMAVINSIKDLGESMLSSLQDVKKQIEQIKLTDNGYKNP